MQCEQKNKVVIMVAPNGAQLAPEILPYLPITPEEIAKEAFRCCDAGASIVHLHARDSKTRSVTAGIGVFNEIVDRVRKGSNMVVELTGAMGAWRDPDTGRLVRATEEQRLALLTVDPKPDMIATVMGTLDTIFHDGGYTTADNHPDYLKKWITEVIQKNIRLDFEIWDTSFLYNALRLAEEGVFDRQMPLLLHYCMGDGNGVQPGTARQLFYVAEEGKRLFPQADWEVTKRGQNYYSMITLGMILGCRVVRVGFEDHFYLPNGQLAKTNAQMVEAVARIVKDLGREVATVEEAREMLGLPG